MTNRDDQLLSEMTDELLTCAQVAAMFGVCRETPRRWASQGKLCSLETAGGHRRFWRSEIESLLRDREVPAHDVATEPRGTPAAN